MLISYDDIEMMSEGLEKEDTDEESSKEDGEYNVPGYSRYKYRNLEKYQQVLILPSKCNVNFTALTKFSFILFRDDVQSKPTKERPRREIREFNPKENMNGKDNEEKIKHTSTRKFYGENEDVYIMDAKSIGIIEYLVISYLTC